MPEHNSQAECPNPKHVLSHSAESISKQSLKLDLC